MAQSTINRPDGPRRNRTFPNRSGSVGNGQKTTETGSGPARSGTRSGHGGESAEHSARSDEAQARVAVDELVATLYRELRQIAHHHLRRERRGHTLNTTALVNEAYVKLATFDQVMWRDRAHFLAIAARAMRHVLVDYAVARKTQKRGGAGQRLSLQEIDVSVEPRIDEVVAIDDALTRLEALNARLVRVVECRFFAGMNIEETAGALALSPATVKRDWSVARAWLNKELVVG
jgi:RNA polymerase sigma-70 factor, ECF subfamily